MKKISLKNLLVVIAATFMLQGLVSCNSAKKQAPAEEKSAVAEKFIGLQL